MFNHYHYTEKEIKEILKSLIILYDSRENQNHHILDWFDKKSIAHVEHTLNFGDYSFMLPAGSADDSYRNIYFDRQIIIERKSSLNELSGNLAQNRQRFEDEMLRAGNCRKILMIESGSLDDIINGNYKTEFSPVSYFGSLLAFSQRYGLETVFIKPEHAGQFIYGTMYYYLRELIK
jgi:ERCC4-type nuclease